MKIWHHRYELKPREAKLKPRHGALLKIEWAFGQIGYSDLHPWPEFGEPDLDAHLLSLQELKFTSLVENSLEFNYTDREYRLLKRNAFLGLILPRSHRLVFDLEEMADSQVHDWHQEGYTHIKVKMGRNLKVETERLVQLACATPLLWRVDFNGRIEEVEFLRWWKTLDPVIKTRIDFVEDPVSDVQLKIAGPWANDWKTQNRASIRIVKPARERDEDLGQYGRVIFTHSLDHTFGQVCAAWVASRYYARHPKRLEVCGLSGGDFFVVDDFSNAWQAAGPRLRPTLGTGFGFDDLLRDLPWQRLL